MFNLYQNTVFLANVSLKYHGLAVITASNPAGRQRTRQFNHWLDCHLLTYLRVRNIPHHWVFAGSIDLNHYEFSAVVECSLIDAQYMAKVFKQQAFYWLDGDCYLYDSQNISQAYSSLGSTASRWFVNRAGYQRMMKEYQNARFIAGAM